HEVVEEGDADEIDENVNAGDVAEGDVSAAHEEVPIVAEEPSISSPTPSTLSISLQLPRKLKRLLKMLRLMKGLIFRRGK
nr:hypothetical protein [Tanacetum cinerariifolium]